jgi:RHH-type rel operon transcriptional repressor/antitoxin RelB
MPTTVRLSQEAEDRLARLAARTGRSKAFYLREMIERGLDDIEDYYLASEVLERIRKGEEDVLGSEEFWRGLDH